MQKEVNKSEGGSLAASLLYSLPFFFIFSLVFILSLRSSFAVNQTSALWLVPLPPRCFTTEREVPGVFGGGRGCSAVEEIRRDHG